LQRWGQDPASFFFLPVPKFLNAVSFSMRMIRPAASNNFFVDFSFVIVQIFSFTTKGMLKLPDPKILSEQLRRHQKQPRRLNPAMDEMPSWLFYLKKMNIAKEGKAGGNRNPPRSQATPDF
jgi:hypothetical protein